MVKALAGYVAGQFIGVKTEARHSMLRVILRLLWGKGEGQPVVHGSHFEANFFSYIIGIRMLC